MKQIGLGNASNSKRRLVAHAIVDMVELDQFITTDGGELHERRVQRIWPKKLNYRIGSLLSNELVDLKGIDRILTETYPLPNKMSTKDSLENGITSQLASLQFPRSRRNSGTGETMGKLPNGGGANDMDMDNELLDGEEENPWLSPETQQVRSNAIKRLAQDLDFMTKTIVSMIEPEVPAGQSLDEDNSAQQHTCQYLYKKPQNKYEPPTPVKVTVPSVIKPIWDEWKVGQDPENYIYRPFTYNSSKVGLDSDVEDEEAEAREREERLLDLRRKREKRDHRVRTSRMKDHSYNINAGGSASQPAPVIPGIITEEDAFSSQMGEADEEGMFSLPTVISASQPVRKPVSLSLSQRPTTKSQTSKSQPSSLGNKASNSVSRKESKEKAKTPHGFGIQPLLSLDHAMFQTPSFLNDSQDWEESLLKEDSLSGGNSFFSNSQQLSGAAAESQQFLSQDLSQDQSQDAGGFMWGASQPVRGTFANRKPLPDAKKVKKKKPRAQGF